jgi:2-aminoadipate transaminase
MTDSHDDAAALANRLLSSTAQATESSAIRDLLAHARRPDIISLAGGIPAPELFPMARLREASSAVLANGGEQTVQYGVTAGEPDARELAAELTGAGSTADNIVITTGSQQALRLLGEVLVDPGDAVVVSDPDYLGALQALRVREPRLVAVDRDRDGMNTDALEAQLRAGLAPKLCYVVPNFHNPTGATLSQERRAHLGALATEFGFVVVEDDPYGELWFGDAPLKPIDPGNPLVVRLRSVSKILVPGLRIGWMTGPRWLLEEVEVSKQSSDLHTSTFSQALVVAMLSDREWFDNHLGAVRSHYRGQRDTLVEALHSTCADAISFDVPVGGMFLWVDCAPGTDTASLLDAALGVGVAYVPGEAFSVQTPATASLRLSYATEPPERLRGAAERLASVLTR